MTSRLVLGAANYGKLTQIEVNKLLGTSFEQGINRIDTAHGYEGSEEKIGVFLKTNKDYQVNTKVGLPDPVVFTPSGIKLSIEESLKRLDLESLGTLFVHSLPAKHLTDENIAAMISLKTEGKIKRIGYAGDGDNLRSAVGIAAFDDFLATFNIIDQSNSKEIKKASEKSEIYYKLVMGQAVWTSLEWKRRVKSHKLMRFLFNKPPVPETWADYCARFNSLKSEIDNRDFATAFLKFALFSGSSRQLVVLGTNSPKHIQDAIKVESEQLDAESIEITRYEDLWLKKSSPGWKAHVG
ncbi:MAG: aldo/keto reductase [Candidatus Planktophila sp.]|nr:aldo/keto reductase [Candidatus Planktophila sp.]